NCRIVCAVANPSIIVTTPPPTTPKPGPCSQCPSLEGLNCDGCVVDDYTKYEKDNVCYAKPSKGRFIFNDDKKESTDELTCKEDPEKTDQDRYRWEAKDGTVVRKLATIEKFTDGLSTGSIVGI
ncbi:hypothetical protein PMAYCL1PPCAC_19425, partial [Pristionchus mayeri]